ncbi:MAG: DUF1501 domain-containing protein [Planctomycetes bacterium]|nr:DUF1501 domain-containing protein [Planctomycetota bacterium]
MVITRRQLIRNAAISAPLFYLGPKSLLRAAFGAVGGGAKNIVFLELSGGLDGLNTVVPFGVNGGIYYTEYRPTIGVPEDDLLKLDTEIGLHPSLAELKTHFDAGRLAICQGVSYPNPNFSHEVASGIWDTGTPSTPFGSGWLARYMALQGVPSFPSAIETNSSLDGLLRGSGQLVPAINSVNEFGLPFDGAYSGDKTNRKTAYQAMAQGLAAQSSQLGTMADTALDIISLENTFKSIPPYTPTATYPNSSISKPLKMVAQLLKANLGLRFFHVVYGGFDTHSDQDKDLYLTKKLQYISKGLNALHADLNALGYGDDTIIVVYTEFGRTAYENGSDGTDHGSVAPVLILGNAVVGGITTPHPSLDPNNLTSQKQPKMVVDLRDVFGTIVERWLNASPSAVFPGFTYNGLGFLP